MKLTKNDKETLKEVSQLLFKSDEGIIGSYPCNMSKAQQLREEAKEIERKDKIIDDYRKILNRNGLDTWTSTEVKND